jgi:hypothetical protein
MGEEVQCRHIRPVHVLDDQHCAAFGDLPDRAQHRLDGRRPTRRDRCEHHPGGVVIHPERRVQPAVGHRSGRRRTRATEDPQLSGVGIREGSVNERRLPDARLTPHDRNGR